MNNFCRKIFIVLAAVNVIASRPPQKKEIVENEEPLESKFDQKAIVTKGHSRNPQERKSMGSIEQDVIEPRPKGMRPSQVKAHPTKNRRHRRSTAAQRWYLLKRGSQVLMRVCEENSTVQDGLRFGQEYVKYLFEDDPFRPGFIPAGCKIMTMTSTRVCPVNEIPMKILQDPPLIVYKQFCEAPGQRNSGVGLGAQEHICEQAHLDVRLADQTVLKVESGCVPKFL